MKAYISCPLSEPQSKIDNTARLLTSLGCENIGWYFRGDVYKDDYL